MKFFNSILETLFPNKCLSCGELIDENEFLCEYCYEMIESIDTLKICSGCGHYKKECECKERVYHFSGAIAPFKNDGQAQEAMYRYKFARVESGAQFFANEMAKMVKTVYADINFDGIAFVPMHPLKELRRGFNQSRLLAQRLSQILGLTVYDGLLSAKYVSKKQHDLPIKERFKNVKGIYSSNYKVTGKTILLVDDIKTTGATLDECAKQLLLAGANDVFCICGLITKQKKGKK